MASGRRFAIYTLVVVAGLGVAVWLTTPPTTRTSPAPAPAPGPIARSATACGGATFNQGPRIEDPAEASATKWFCHSFYEVAYSTRLRDPLWSAEHLTREMAQASDTFGRTKTPFVREPELSPEDQGDSADFIDSGFDRGHMTPANDAPDVASETGTFMVTNIVPQSKVLNERLWQYLEASVHEIAKRDGEVYVVTGPIFADAPPRLANRIAIPAFTFKAIYVPSTGVAAAYIATNAAEPACVVVSLDTLRQRAGIDPFPALPDQMKTTLADFELPHGVRPVRGEARQVPLPDCEPASADSPVFRTLVSGD